MSQLVTLIILDHAVESSCLSYLLEFTSSLFRLFYLSYMETVFALHFFNLPLVLKRNALSYTVLQTATMKCFSENKS